VKRPRLTLLIVFSLSTIGNAAIITFAGNDSGAGFGVAHPSSDAAQASFAAAAGLLGSGGLITFESTALGTIPNGVPFNLGAGVTVTLNNNDPTCCSSGNTGISNDNTNNVLGFNITAGGSRFLRVAPMFDGGTVTAVFNFAIPIVAFGAYFTGTETTVDGTYTIIFNDGSAQSLPLTKNAVAGTQFFGFTDVGMTIASVTINEAGPFSSRDIWGLDNLQFTSVPEPGAIPLFPLFVPALALAARLRRK